MKHNDLQIFKGVDDGFIYIFMNHKGRGKVYKFENEETVLTALKAHSNKKLNGKKNG